MLEISIILIYCFFFSFIVLFSIGQLALLISYLLNKKKESPSIDWKILPLITVQLPIYNERFVIARLLDSISRLNYPKESLEIQVLDDSTDDTGLIVEKKIKELSAMGLNIRHILRENRQGFKAGALQNGLQSASGEYVAIFDADFIPESNFLIKTIGYFTSDQIGMVQTRWEHINPKQSWLTRAQETGLNGHFTIDQIGRNRSGYFINFNGTAGIWRKTCIIDAGGWQSDTLTEDLDISYRAQMKGWKFNYQPEIMTPAELPEQLSAVRSQQFRWTKGGIETSKKLLVKLWKEKLLFKIKLFGSFHLLNNYIYAFILLSALSSIPLMFVKNMSDEFDQFFRWNTVLVVVVLINFLYCYISILIDNKNKVSALKESLTAFPIAIIISLGMSYHNTRAILQGIKGGKSIFERTPKLNKATEADPYLKKQKIDEYLPEVLLFSIFLLAVFCGLYFKDPGFLIYHGLMLAGFGTILYHAYTEISRK